MAMTPITLPCFYSLSSPWAYLGGPKLQDIVRRHHVKLELKPYDFQAIADITGSVPLRSRPQPRIDYHSLELARWSQYLGIPLVVTPKYYPWVVTDPDWNKRPGWMVIAAQERGLDAFRLSHALLRALWAEERNTADAGVRRAIAEENGMDGRSLVAVEDTTEVRTIYQRYTDEAVQNGVFGAPTFILNGERFWGQDRLDFLDRALDAERAKR